MKFDHDKFFQGFKDDFDSSLDQSQVDGIEFLLTSFENNPLYKDVRHISYCLATIYHETAASMQPVEEGYYLGNPDRVKRFQKTLRYYPYFGRGYVQLTWDTGNKKNYTKAGNALGLDLHNHPELALEKENAFPIMTLGMFQGWFTGKKLSDYIHGSTCDYVNARRIINGTDKAGLIAGYAKKFEQILKDSTAALTSENNAPSDQSVLDSTLNQSATNPADGQPPTPVSVETTSTTVQDDNGTSTATVTTATASEPVTVKNVAMSLWSKVVAALGALTALGINGGTIIETKISEITLNQVFLAALGVGLFIAVLFYVKSRQAANDAKTHALIAAAADKDKHTVVLEK